MDNIGEKVLSFGIVTMLLGAVLFILYIPLWLWFDIPETVTKVLATIVSGGFFIFVIGIFLPNKY